MSAPKARRLVVYLPPETYRAIQEEAKRDDRPSSVVARRVLVGRFSPPTRTPFQAPAMERVEQPVNPAKRIRREARPDPKAAK